MRMLVTGGGGFLGSHLADAISAAGHVARILDLAPSPWRRPEQEQLVGDVRDADVVAAAVEGCEVVFHLAAIADLAAAEADPGLARDVNVGGTATVLAAAERAGTSRFVLASSVYALSRGGRAYPDTKRAAETLVRAAGQRGLATTILRFGSVYGPRADAGNAVRRILTQALAERRIDFWGDGTEVREYVHVQDAARLALEALDPEHVGATLHLTGRDRTTTRELLEMVDEMLGGGVAITYGDRPFEGRYRLTPFALDEGDEDVELASTLVGRTHVDLGIGLLQTLRQLQREGPGPTA